MMWKKALSVEQLNQFCQHSAVSHLGIQFSVRGDDFLEATLCVDSRTTQPFGLLHGGVSAALAETLGSAAAMLCCEENQTPVGTELTISHLRAVKTGMVTGRASSLYQSRTRQLWQVDLRNQEGELCASARLSIQLLSK